MLAAAWHARHKLQRYRSWMSGAKERKCIPFGFLRLRRRMLQLMQL